MTITYRSPKCGHTHIVEADNKTDCEKGMKVWQKQHKCKRSLNAKGKDFKPGRAQIQRESTKRTHKSMM